MDSFWYPYVILPLLIILARIVDVSIGTIKIIFISKGYKYLAPILGFFEVIVWLLAVTRIFQNLDNWVCFFAYPFGFALGSFIGLKLEEKLALGVQLMRIITSKDASDLIYALSARGFSVTSFKAMGAKGEVGIIYSVINRRNISAYVDIIKTYNPNAFYTIEDIRFVSQQVAATPRRDYHKRK
jgi:uncharacterized protein YebE (UPF0316 family)